MYGLGQDENGYTLTEDENGYTLVVDVTDTPMIEQQAAFPWWLLGLLALGIALSKGK